MNEYDRLPDAAAEIFGEEATAERTYDLLTVDVPVGSWIAALETARDKLGCTYFDWLSAVDEPGVGFRVCAHVVALERGRVRRLLVRTTVPHEAPVLPSAVEIYAGAGWHERETYEMFGVTFADHPHLVPLLLPDGFEGHPLRKDFVLAARVAKAWPGAKEPGESEHGGPKRRQMLPPGVPDPNEWGPLKGQLPPAPARPARAARGAAGASGDRPPRRARSVSEGSASQTTEAPSAPEAPEARPRRAHGASEGSATQRGETTAMPDASAPAQDASAPKGAGPVGPRSSRASGSGSASASQRQEADAPAEPPVQEPADTGEAADAPTSAPRTRSADAPWHQARPAFGGDANSDPDTDANTNRDTSAHRDPDTSADADTDADTPPGTPKDIPPTPRPKSGSAEGPDDEPTESAGGDA
ncbi:NADH-quinone oxidoreductase subunit C [Streptomyces sp. NPDC001820]|uniref:NADH-quinone oxidoreductase subunit C n=1 Tax=Streptomyces sp. NPDC001820 TaxID=3364613 RepID=UPI0036D1D641